MYDAIVVGARCAGSPTAMLLARMGHRVLLVDRASFPSDTLSTHYIHQSGVAHLERWGLLPRIVAAGAAGVRDYTLDVGPFALQGAPPPLGAVDRGYSLRRMVLDEILVEEAARAGAVVRQQFPVEGLVTEGARVVGIRSRGRTEHARIVIGADGLGSLVARAVGAPTYNDNGTLTCAYYAYWTGVEMRGVELYPRDGQMIVAAPTDDDQVVIAAFWPRGEFHGVRSDVERHFMAALDRAAPGLAERVRAGTRVERFRGSGRLPNVYRRPHGDGWALVGDAGHHKDPILALGIGDAFRDAGLLAEAVDDGLRGGAPMDRALAGYEQRRNALSAGGFQSTLDFARLQAPPPLMQQLFMALRDRPDDRDRLFGTFAGTVPADEFFSPDNLARILAPLPKAA
jgi:2-polyprenyl-6-methoxyphenol hydroxylase-like FAD-dependent oxidoreductase